MGLSSHLLIALTCAFCVSSQTTDDSVTDVPCVYNFNGPADVLFLLDISPGIGKNNFDELKTFLMTFIINTMVVGPEPNSEYVRIGVTLFRNQGNSTVIDLISNSDPVYESEFFADGGLFHNNVKYNAVIGRSENSGFIDSIQSAEGIFLAQNITDRRKILIVATNAFTQGGDAKQAVSDMSARIVQEGGSLEVYGVGYGNQYDYNELDKLLMAVADPCNLMDLVEWTSWSETKGNHPNKTVTGVKRHFSDQLLCCSLCVLQEGGLAVPACSAPEYRGDHGLLLDCDQTSDAYVCSPTTQGTYKDTTESDEEREEKDEDGDTMFTVFAIIFGVVNFILVLMFVIICIYAHKLGPSKTVKPKKPESNTRTLPRPSDIDRQRGQHGGSQPVPPSEPVLRDHISRRPIMPSRIAPVVPMVRTTRPVTQYPAQDNDSFEEDEALYGNEDVAKMVNNNGRSLPRDHNDVQLEPRQPAEEYVPASSADEYNDDFEDARGDYTNIEEARGDYENIDFDQPKTFAGVFRKDVKHQWDRLKKRVSSRGSQQLEDIELSRQADETVPTSPLSNTILQSRIPPIGHQPNKSSFKIPSPFKKKVQERAKKNSGRNYVNKDVIQEIHDAKQQREAGNELQQKLENARRRTELVSDPEFMNDPESLEEPEDTFGTDYENVNVINERIHQGM